MSADEFRAALRVGDSAEEIAETTRIYAYASEAVEKYAASAPDVTKSEAIVRLGSYLFDQPTSARGDAYAAAGRNSGAWSILAPYRIRRAGTIGEAVQTARESGTKTNPVVDVKISGGQLVVSYADETSQAYDLPDGMGGGPGEDATARDAAAAAQGTAEAAQAEIDAHEATTHNTDPTARDAAASAQSTADAAQSDIDAHEATTHNTDPTARDAAASAQSTADAAQSDIDAHEATTHNTDRTARDAAAAAQRAAEEAAGGRPRVIYEAASVAIGGNTALVDGNVACPPTGDLEFYFETLTGTRRGGVAYARIPVARIRGAVSALAIAYANDSPDILAIAHGANRGIGVSVQENTNFLMLSAQAPGDYFIRIAHKPRG